MKVSLRKIISIFVLISGQLSIGICQVNFDDYFESKSLRFDFYLAGNAQHQAVYVDCFREEPYWAGPRMHLIDNPEYGEYYCNVYDEASGKFVYGKGFCSLFQEWQTTDEAKTIERSYSQTVIIPYPKQTVRLEISVRSYKTGKFEPLFQTTVDPKSIFIRREKSPSYPVTEILRNGEIAEKVDLVFVAEGYTVSEMDKFRKDAARFTDFLFRIEPFAGRKKDFNVWAVESPSEESGTDIPGEGIWKNTALNAGFWTFGIDRYLTTSDLFAVRDRVRNVPCDAVYVIVNSSKYGGGGIYNYYGLGTADHESSCSVFVHEFGHSFAGLADEYYTSEVTYNDFYNLKNEPWEPNITTLVNFDTKWKDMLPPGTPVPTPDTEKNKNKIGVYEGGGYVSKGVYRPMIDCRMHSNRSDFCPVCRRAINRMIDWSIDK